MFGMTPSIKIIVKVQNY